MRLAEIRGLIKSITDYDPNTTTYDDELTRIINNVYLELFAEKPWTFAQNEVVKTARADDTATNGTTTNSTRDISTGSGFFIDAMEGQVIEIQDAEYEIPSVISSTSANLKQLFTGSTVSGTDTFKVKYRYLDLPVNCISVLQIGRRDRTTTPSSEPGRYTPLTRMEDEWFNINLDETGTPTDWIPYDDFNVQSPIKPPVVTTSGTPGSGWPADTYTFVYTLNYGNRYSAASSAVVLTTTEAHPTLSVTLPDLTTVSGSDASGFKKQAWIKFSPYKAFRKFGAEIVESDTSVSAGVYGDNWELGDRLNNNGGNYRRVRLYPRTSSDISVTIRYISAPEMLLEDSDSPQMPGAHHQYLAYKALVDVFSKHDNTVQAEVYRRKAELEILKMEQRYLSEISRRWVKSGYGIESTFRPNRFGPLTTSG